MVTCDKTRYSTGSKAAAALNGIRRRGPRDGKNKPIRAYLCPRCHGWHLTSQPT